ncbi:phage tail protein [Citrobacter braakii]|uniref:phage tail protein n=1 Tax=Citrobacter braakii TaxID=57706 RepID=UPI00403A0E53
MAATTFTTEQQRPKHSQWGALGDITFRTHSSPGRVSDDRRWKWSAQKVINGYPVHQAGGEDERTTTLNITLNNRFVSIADSYQKLIAIAAAEVPRALVIGTDFRGYFVVTGIQETVNTTTPEGTITEAAYSLTLKEVRGENTV